MVKRGKKKGKHKKKKEKRKEELSIPLMILRYFIILIIVFGGLNLVYLILAPLTVLLSYIILNLFYDVVLAQNFLLVNNIPIEIVSACIAGSAYLLMIILNLSIGMKHEKRLYSLSFSLILLFFVNVLRIVVFSSLYVSSFKFFDLTHLVFWYVVSVLIVFIIWILTINLFKIKEIPFYTDLKYLYKLSKAKKNKRR